VNWGKEIVRTCPKSLIDWEILTDAIDAYDYYEAGFLPETYDEKKDKPCSILDQPEFYKTAHAIVKSAINSAEKQAMDRAQSASKSKK